MIDARGGRTIAEAKACPVAGYLYPNTYLCGPSAERLAPTADRRLFLSGRRNFRTRLLNLEIVQTRAPRAPETEVVQTTDPIGELRVRRSTLRFRYLESFRRRSEAGAVMPIEMQTEIAARLVEFAGGEEAAIIECWRLAAGGSQRMANGGGAGRRVHRHAAARGVAAGDGTSCRLAR